MFKRKYCSGGDGCLGGVLEWGLDDIRAWDLGQGLKGKGKKCQSQGPRTHFINY